MTMKKKKKKEAEQEIHTKDAVNGRADLEWYVAAAFATLAAAY